MSGNPPRRRAAWSILFFDLTLWPFLKALTRPFIKRLPWAACVATFVTHPIAGMFYLGRWKRALLYALLSPLCIAVEIYLLLHVEGFPNPPYVFLLDALVLRVIGAVDAYHIAKSWQPSTAWYTRWYAAIGLWLAVIVGSFTIVTLVRVSVSEVYSALTDIARPTLTKDDIFLLFKMPSAYHPGDLVAVEQVLYGKPRRLFWRVIALPGDEVEIKASQLIVNGKEVLLKDIGGGIYEETLPDGQHYQVHSTHVVDMASQKIPEGMLFLLSDDRDIYHNTHFFTQPEFVLVDNFLGKVVFVCKHPCPLKAKL